MAKNSAINISSTSSAIVTDEDGVLVATSPMTNGQVLIGSTGASPVAASLTAGSGISITPGAGALTISATGVSSGETSGGLINVQYLTTSGTYTATPGTVSCLVMAVGGGGGGGGMGLLSLSPDRTYTGASSGGSGGAFGQKYYAVAPTGSAYTIGAGGAGGGGQIEDQAGESGGATTFNNGDMHLLGGGAGIRGFYSIMENTIRYLSSFPGGYPDPSDNSDFTSNGSIGGAGLVAISYSSSIYYGSGFGGESMLGMGAICPAFAYNTSEPGLNAIGYGGGGSGAAGVIGPGALQVQRSGGSGGPGIIIVYEYS